ncbi:ASM3B-like protein, partial [Mya arenaria]
SWTRWPLFDPTLPSSIPARDRATIYLLCFGFDTWAVTFNDHRQPCYRKKISLYRPPSTFADHNLHLIDYRQPLSTIDTICTPQTTFCRPPLTDFRPTPTFLRTLTNAGRQHITAVRQSTIFANSSLPTNNIFNNRLSTRDPWLSACVNRALNSIATFDSQLTPVTGSGTQGRKCGWGFKHCNLCQPAHLTWLSVGRKCEWGFNNKATFNNQHTTIACQRDASVSAFDKWLAVGRKCEWGFNHKETFDNQLTTSGCHWDAKIDASMSGALIALQSLTNQLTTNDSQRDASVRGALIAQQSLTNQLTTNGSQRDASRDASMSGALIALQYLTNQLTTSDSQRDASVSGALIAQQSLTNQLTTIDCQRDASVSWALNSIATFDKQLTTIDCQRDSEGPKCEWVFNSTATFDNQTTTIDCQRNTSVSGALIAQQPLTTKSRPLTVRGTQRDASMSGALIALQSLTNQLTTNDSQRDASVSGALIAQQSLTNQLTTNGSQRDASEFLTKQIHYTRNEAPSIAGESSAVWCLSAAGDPTNMCHQGNGSHDNVGTYGNYMCDSPWNLITSAIQAMYKIKPDPDFIIWTGDSVPHVDDSDLDPDKVYMLIGNVTNELVSVFPNTTLYPVLGNHDPYPANQMPYDTDNTAYYKGGYYSSKISEKLRLIGLNTNLYYDQDRLTKDLPDPAQQMDFLDKQLQEARKHNQMVYIIAHVPPGVFELGSGLTWFYPKYNKQYLEKLEEFADIITLQLYGHEHTDSFRVQFDAEANKHDAAGPRSDPLEEHTPGGRSKQPIYPAVQVRPGKWGTGDDWQKEYDTSDVYALDELRPAKLHELARAFTDRSNKLFQHYLQYNSVLWAGNTECNETCHLHHLCAITQLDYDNFRTCISGGVTTHHPTQTTHHHPHRPTPQPQVPTYMFYLIGGLAAVVFLLFLVVACMCLRKGRRLRAPRYAKFGSLSLNS